jgi:hypothetical protein
MKPIIIFNRTITDLPATVGKIIQKKNKTILKDFKQAQTILTNYQPADYQYNLEDWEVVTHDYVQIILSFNGDKIRPVHIVVDHLPKYGFKALYQTNSMVSFRFDGENFLLKSGFIQKDGLFRYKTIASGKAQQIEDILKMADQKYHPAITACITQWESCIDAYKYPIWAKTDDRKIPVQQIPANQQPA